MLAEPDSRVRANAVEGLWETRSSLAAALFREAALDPDHRVAANALIGLHCCGETEGVITDVLGNMLRSQNPLARSAAAFASGYIMDVNSTSALEGLLRDRDASVRGQALRALIRIRRQDRPKPPQSWPLTPPLPPALPLRFRRKPCRSKPSLPRKSSLPSLRPGGLTVTSVRFCTPQLLQTHTSSRFVTFPCIRIFRLASL